MSQTVKEETPIELLGKTVKNIILTYEDDKEKMVHIEEAIEKAKSYEMEYYNNCYSMTMKRLKDAQREIKGLSTQNRVLTEYISMKEELGSLV